jgi:hypothetical protein
LKIIEPQLRQSTPQLSERCNNPIGSSCFPESLITEVELTTLQSRPWQPGFEHPSLKSFVLEGQAIKHAIVDINPVDQLGLNVIPVGPKSIQGRHVDRRAGVLHSGDRGHVAATQQCTREINPRPHGWQ